MQARACAVQLQSGCGFGTTAAAQEQQLAAKDETISRLEQEYADLKQKLHPGRLDFLRMHSCVSSRLPQQLICSCQRTN